MLNVLLIECGIDCSSIENALISDGIDFHKRKGNAIILPAVKDIRPDIVILAVDKFNDKLVVDLHAINQHLPLPVIVFSCDASLETINKVIKADVSIYLIDMLPCQHIVSLIHVAISSFNHRQALKHELEEVRTLLEDRKQIDRAKAILIKTQNFSEDEAYHTLRKLAMDRNITLGEMSRNVIAMAELLK